MNIVHLRSATRRVPRTDPLTTGRDRARYIDIGGIRNGRIDDAHTIRTADAPTRARQVVEAGDTLFATVRPYLRKIALVPQSLDGEFASTGFCVLRPGDGLDPRYLNYFLNSDRALDQILPLQRGVSYPAVLDKDVLATLIPLPGIEDQRRLTGLIDELMASLDSAREGFDTVEAKVRGFRMSSAKTVFNALSDQFGWAPALELVDIVNGQTPKGLLDNLEEIQTEDRVPYFKVGDMNSATGREMSNARFFVSRSEARQYGLHVHDSPMVLFPKRGGAIATNKKRVLRTSGAFDLNTMGLRPIADVSVDYIWHWLQIVDLGRIADGSNVPQINARQIRSLSIPRADASTQVRVVGELDETFESADRLESDVARARARGEALRRAILTAAFTGRLTGHPSDADRIEEIAETELSQDPVART